MGVVLSYFGPGARTDDPDPVTGLTSKDKLVLVRSWEIVRKNPTDSGVALMSEFFKQYPKYQEFFPFRDIPFDDLPNNKKFRGHCNSVVYKFTSIVDAVYSTDLLVEILTKIGETHASRNLTGEAFLHLQGVVIDVLKKLMKENEIDTWKKFLDVGFPVMINGLESEAQKLKQNSVVST